MPIFSINYIINFNIGSVVSMKDRYAALDTLYPSYSTSYFASYSLNLQIKAVDISLSDTTDTASTTVNLSSTLELKYYQYIHLKNLNWIFLIATASTSVSSIFTVVNKYFILEGMALSLSR